MGSATSKNIGGKAKRKETTRKTNAWIGSMDLIDLTQDRVH
jgi:hypothetical protein